MSGGDIDIKPTESGKAILPAFQAFVVTGEVALVCWAFGGIFPYYHKQLVLDASSNFSESTRGAQLPLIAEYCEKFGKILTASPVLSALAIIAFGFVLWFFLKKIIKPKKPFAGAVVLLGGSFLITALFLTAATFAVYLPLSERLSCAHCVSPEDVIKNQLQKKSDRPESPPAQSAQNFEQPAP